MDKKFVNIIVEMKGKMERGNRKDGFPLLALMQVRAMNDSDYQEKFEKWLVEGGTVFLRDELAEPFKDAAFVKELKNKGRYNPYADAWMQLDTAGYYVRCGYEYS